MEYRGLWRLMLIKVWLLMNLVGLSAQVLVPYLQSPTDTSVWITWKTDANPESKVLYGKDSLALEVTVNGDCQVLSDVGYDGNYFYHSVQLTGLEPDHYYYYRIVTGILQSPIFRFRTQPSFGTSPGIYRFLVFGDHQVKDSDRYERLLKAAREKIIEQYGGTVEEHVNLIINDGDQVDAGTLDQYEFVHFKPSAILSGNVPVMTTVGNHETYGSLGLSAYYSHFFYDGLGYKEIVSPGGENYYSYQVKNIVFIHLSSEHQTDEQVEWVRQIVDSVSTDPSVDWLISVAHRPIQAEQFVGDISTYIRNRIIPVLAQTQKSSLFISGHHHLYARGQIRDFPMYHIISGGGSWDQFWGQSVEKDFDDVQKTIDYWTYQIVSIDATRKEMVVECYAIGSPKLGFTLDNVLIDSFYRKLPATPPDRPEITTAPVDSVSLPFTFESSPFSSGGPEPYNSTQFQIASEQDFSKIDIDLIRDYENLFGTTGSPDFLPVDIHDTVDIFKYTIRRNDLPNGTYHIRVRHRDRNINWSEWSDPIEFKVRGSAGGFTAISTTKDAFRPDENIEVSYVFGPGNITDWIGIYRMGETPGSVPSTDWAYVEGSSGSVNLDVSGSGKYFIGFFEEDGYYELAERILIYIVPEPVLTLDKAGYEVGEEILVNYSNAPGMEYDWIGVYTLDDTPGMIAATLWDYTSGTSGDVTFAGLLSGYYFLSYFIDNIYIEAGERVVFSVGSELATLSSDKPVYKQDEPVKITFEDSPGLTTDWIGIFIQNAPPGKAPLVVRQFTSDPRTGNVIFDHFFDPGPFYAAMYINNSTVRISNKAYFTVESGTTQTEIESGNPELTIYPTPTTGHLRISAASLSDNDVYIRITSISGTTVFEKSTEASASTFAEDIDISGQYPGIYLVYLKTGDKIFINKLVLTNL